MSPARPDSFPALVVRGPSWRRRFSNRALVVVCWLSAGVVLVPLALIVGHLLARGLPALDLDFFTHMPAPVGEPGGGMANAIVGTAILVALGLLLAVPLGVGTGVYLAEHGNNLFGTVVRYTADVLSGVPSIVVGVATYGLVVVTLGHFSALAG